QRVCPTVGVPATSDEARASEPPLSRKVCGVVEFPNHDELVVAYSGGLLGRTLKVRTAESLTLFDTAAVKLELAEPPASIELPVTVVEVSEQRASKQPWARLRFDAQSNALLEAFVLRCDPSALEVRSAPGRRSLKVVVVDDNRAQRELAARP